ncbi:hypothetical protein F4806DRAFT_465594 [Annulohypoxylon nitens]|nr:hypothetical protein F4806DRAFT_465594 [Annulohypoxylon nitens]
MGLGTIVRAALFWIWPLVGQWGPGLCIGYGSIDASCKEQSQLSGVIGQRQVWRCGNWNGTSVVCSLAKQITVRYVWVGPLSDS